MTKNLQLSILIILLPHSLVDGSEADTIKTYGKHLYFKTQYAGNLGLISAGIGKEFSNVFSMDLSYGYLPKFINGARVHTFSAKTAFLVKKFSLSGIQPAFHLGASINYAITHDTFLRYPAYYPEGYYLPNALHLCPFIRVGVGIPRKDKKFGMISVFSEIGTVEYEIYNAVRDKGVKFYDIWNICFGLSFHFTKKQ
jgi:hypothetical protein